MPTRIFDTRIASLRTEDRTAWAAIPVTIASDITAGRVIVDRRIRPLRPFAAGKRLVGRAITAWCERGDFGAMLHAMDRAGTGDVVVVDAGGSLETAYAGEILCGFARNKGMAGLIVDGAVRDIDTLASWDDFAVFARAYAERSFVEGARRGERADRAGRRRRGAR